MAQIHRDSKGREMKISIDPKKCTGCGDCVLICPEDVLEINEGLDKCNVVNMDACTGCQACEVSCETNAISIEL